jgi:hypothetical protein
LMSSSAGEQLALAGKRAWLKGLAKLDGFASGDVGGEAAG